MPISDWGPLLASVDAIRAEEKFDVIQAVGAPWMDEDARGRLIFALRSAMGDEGEAVEDMIEGARAALHARLEEGHHGD